jgi:hypothetical protein
MAAGTSAVVATAEPGSAAADTGKAAPGTAATETVPLESPLRLSLIASGAIESALKGDSTNQPLTGSLGFMFSSDPDNMLATQNTFHTWGLLHESLRGLVSVAASASAALSGDSPEPFLQALLSDSPNQPGVTNFVSLDYRREWEYSGASHQSYGYRLFASSGVQNWQARVAMQPTLSPETITRLGARARWTCVNFQPAHDRNSFSMALELGGALHWVGSTNANAITVRDSALGADRWMYKSLDLGVEITVRQLRAVVNMPYFASGSPRDRASRNSVQFVLETPLVEIGRLRGQEYRHDPDADRRDQERRRKHDAERAAHAAAPDSAGAGWIRR